MAASASAGLSAVARPIRAGGMQPHGAAELRRVQSLVAGRGQAGELAGERRDPGLSPFPPSRLEFFLGSEGTSVPAFVQDGGRVDLVQRGQIGRVLEVIPGVTRAVVPRAAVVAVQVPREERHKADVRLGPRQRDPDRTGVRNWLALLRWPIADGGRLVR